MGASKANREAAAAEYRQMDGEAALLRLVRESDPEEAADLDAILADLDRARRQMALLYTELRAELPGRGYTNRVLDIDRYLVRAQHRQVARIYADRMENSLHTLALSAVSAGAGQEKSPLGR